ncbi:DUF4381 domain-containing protein [Rhodoferax sp. 4810]|uniref:DUF4381 domain-containing protein n=1 Tax=Thiospirillum jenense TaxID=1653858 RepID=A0A839H7J9_9GAMM|nr:DUF4381 domain-containing protein [Thiospirillum jenense]MBB1073119.1 DUF4381 domain-containing protein [Rhodoferax jenense]MBB1124720.1 DUF4381 domain-containing protein [Thiospirillum jenense]
MTPTAPVSFPLPLRDLYLSSPAWWPPAIGWWLLIGATTILLIISGIMLYRWWRRRQLRTQVLIELAQIAALNPSPAQIAAIASLLKRVALHRFATEPGIASLSGADWLKFLDQTGGYGQFQHGVGQLLAAGPYAPALPNNDTAAAIAAARTWLERTL